MLPGHDRKVMEQQQQEGSDLCGQVNMPFSYCRRTRSCPVTRSSIASECRGQTVTKPLELPLAGGVAADARRGNISQLENVFSLLTHPLVCFGRVVFGGRFAFPFSLKTRFTDGAFFCLLTLTISLPLIHKHTSLVVHCLLGSQRLCVCAASGD